jgi:hypothetical protein
MANRDGCTAATAGQSLTGVHRESKENDFLSKENDFHERAMLFFPQHCGIGLKA